MLWYDGRVSRTPSHVPLLALTAALFALPSACHSQRPWIDSDGDGWVNKLDCAPANAAINPDADERCGDGLDNNCNGIQDEYCSSMGDIAFHEICGVNARREVVCWHDSTCGTNDIGEIVCWDPSLNLPLLDPRLSMSELETWASFTCGRSVYGDVTCTSPIRLASTQLPDGETRFFTSWEISPAFRTLTPIVEEELGLEIRAAAEVPR